MVLSPEQIQKACLRHVEAAVADLETLSIMMESFQLYSSKERLKENLIASMKLRIMNIEESIRSAYKFRDFGKFSDALMLPELLLQFVLEHSRETELVQPLAELLLERVATTCNLQGLFSRNFALLKEALRKAGGSRCTKAVLKWLGRQLEKNSQHPPCPLGFLY
jgi:hypothetical protein